MNLTIASEQTVPASALLAVSTRTEVTRWSGMSSREPPLNHQFDSLDVAAASVFC